MFSRTQKIVKLNITTQRKNLWLLALDLAKNKLWWLKEISIFSLLSTWNFFLRENIFVTDIAVLTIENIRLVFNPVFVK